MLPVLSYGDAVGNDTLAIAEILAEQGYGKEIFTDIIDDRLPAETAEKISDLEDLSDDDILIYHMATATKRNYELPNFGGKHIMIYHNITPPYFFKDYSSGLVNACQEGYDQVKFLSDKMDYCIADSEYNKQDLIRMGFTCPIDVCPIIIPFEDYDQEPNQVILNNYGSGDVTNILFVGRIAPNKKFEDIILAFYIYHKYYNPKSRLILCGSYNGMEKYYQRLLDYARRLRITDSIIFTGHIRFNEILAWYHAADLFLCMSEHEGFCVPLAEAMYFGIPIVAYSSCAVPDTLGKGGVLLENKDPKSTAEVMNKIVNDEEFRNDIKMMQKKQLQQFQYENVKKIFLECLNRFS